MKLFRRRNKIILLVVLFVFIAYFYFNWNESFAVFQRIELLEIERLNASKYWILVEKTKATGVYSDRILSDNPEFQAISVNSSNKIWAYLTAIKSGASFIYDVDDSIHLHANIFKHFVTAETSYCISYKCTAPRTINIYAHFGQRSICTKSSLPCNESNIFYKYTCGQRETSIIQHALINSNEVQFDDSSPSVQIPSFKLTFYAAHKNTFYHYDAFWSLFSPTSLSNTLYAEIIRSCWAQRLVWLLSKTVTIHGPNSFSKHNFYDSTKLNAEEKVKVESLIELLFNWECDKLDFFECVLDLGHKLAEKHYWDRKDVKLLKHWLENLINIGYIQPLMANTELKNECDKTSSHGFDKFDLSYMPNFDNEAKSNRIVKNEHALVIQNQFCSLSQVKLNYTPVILEQSFDSFPNIILIVSFNHEPVPENIAMIKSVYSAYFKNIIFCGPYINLMLKDVEKSFQRIFDAYTFIDIDTNKGYFHYYCMTKAIELGFVTDGFLLQSDDVLFKYWRFFKEFDFRLMGESFISFKSNGYDSDPRENFTCSYELATFSTRWFYWNTEFGLSAIKKVFNYFDLVLNGDSRADRHLENSDKEIIKRFVLTLKQHADSKTGPPKVCLFGSDVFYVPRSKFEDFHFFSELFRKNEVFLELATSTIIAGLDYDGRSIQKIEGEYYWDSEYPFSFDSYDQIIQ